jgi:hypothetical protein
MPGGFSLLYSTLLLQSQWEKFLNKKFQMTKFSVSNNCSNIGIGNLNIWNIMN